MDPREIENPKAEEDFKSQEKREAFIKKAHKNKANFEKHFALKKEVFGDMDPNDLKLLLENGDINDWFSLLLIEYAEQYYEYRVELNRAAEKN
ncbi:hypothetical protein ACJRPK_14035 [Aquimarina sp. 2-A2]|uniref:hypothetical protein n=1 Tax=Aquimarina sp. 2-A2 TaxID=3382644 RepID=UPI00387F37BE